MAEEKENDDANEDPGDGLVPLEPGLLPVVREGGVRLDAGVELLVDFLGREGQHVGGDQDHHNGRDQRRVHPHVSHVLT